jgi:hypothetical protein
VRPHNEPTKLRDTFAIYPREVVTMESDTFEPQETDAIIPRCKCQCGISSWFAGLIGRKP